MYLEFGGPVELWKWRSASTLEAAPMWVSPTQTHVLTTDSYDPSRTSEGYDTKTLRPSDILSAICLMICYGP